MSKYVEIFNYLRQCPQLSDLWSVGATEDDARKVIFPQGTSQRYELKEFIDTTGSYNGEFIPYPTVYEDFHINAYYFLDKQSGETPETSVNVLNLDDAQAICDWIIEQNDKNNLPKITGKQVISIEPLPFNPQVLGTSEDFIAYFITVRIRYVNTSVRKSVEYDG